MTISRVLHIGQHPHNQDEKERKKDKDRHKERRNKRWKEGKYRNLAKLLAIVFNEDPRKWVFAACETVRQLYFAITQENILSIRLPETVITVPDVCRSVQSSGSAADNVCLWTPGATQCNDTYSKPIPSAWWMDLLLTQMFKYLFSSFKKPSNCHIQRE